MKHFIIPACESIRSAWDTLWDWLWNAPPEELLFALGVTGMAWLAVGALIRLAGWLLANNNGIVKKVP